jgi:hypothetical protein
VALPEPAPGLVIRYSYLWRSEHLQGHEEGVKDRPCAIILAVTNDSGDQVVTVLPITHSTPAEGDAAIEIPTLTKKRLGLDEERSWIMLTEANRFVWPGPDLRPATPGDLASAAYGLLPKLLYEQVRRQFVVAIKARQSHVVARTE